MDDNARVFSTEMEHPVMIGVPIADRISDLTPPISGTAVKGSPQWENAQITDPNSDDMIRFLKDERQPYAEERYGPSFHKVLFGYSLGGIFTLQTLITEPEPFDSYITASPSLWYRNTTMKRSQSRPQNT
jgi:predicted alpha/beta superfamily hydrolase